TMGRMPCVAAPTAEGGFRYGGVAHTGRAEFFQQALSGAEYATKLTDIFTHDKHAGVLFHGLGDGLVHGLGNGQLAFLAVFPHSRLTHNFSLSTEHMFKRLLCRWFRSSPDPSNSL